MTRAASRSTGSERRRSTPWSGTSAAPDRMRPSGIAPPDHLLAGFRGGLDLADVLTELRHLLTAMTPGDIDPDQGEDVQ